MAFALQGFGYDDVVYQKEKLTAYDSMLTFSCGIKVKKYFFFL